MMKKYLYLVIVDRDVDGGFGDAIPTKEPVILFHQKELAEKYVKENSNPHVYDVPYDDLYEGGLQSLKKYYLHLIKGDKNSYLNITPVGGLVLGSHLEDNGWKNKFTHEEIISMNPQLLLFEEEVEK